MSPSPCFSLLEEALRHETETSDRKLLNEIKLLHSFGRDKWVRRALDQLSTSLDVALPVERFRTCGPPKTEAFVDSQWPHD